MEAALVVLPGSFETRITESVAAFLKSRRYHPSQKKRPLAASTECDRTIDQTNVENEFTVSAAQ